jgi:hypothetical protein
MAVGHGPARFLPAWLKRRFGEINGKINEGGANVILPSAMPAL